VNARDYFIMACEIIFVLFIIYYIVEEAFEMRAMKMAYIKSLWNILDLIVISVGLSLIKESLSDKLLQVSLVCIGFGIYTHFVVQEKLKDLLKDPDQYADFGSLGYL